MWSKKPWTAKVSRLSSHCVGKKNQFIIPNSPFTLRLPTSRTLNYKVNKEYVFSLSPIHILQCPSLENLSHVWWLGSTPQLNQINYEVAFESYTQAKYFWNILDRFNGQKISKRKLDIFFLKKTPRKCLPNFCPSL